MSETGLVERLKAAPGKPRSLYPPPHTSPGEVVGVADKEDGGLVVESVGARGQGQMEGVDHVDVEISERDSLAGAKLVIQRVRPSWPHQRLQFKIFTDGITNKLIGCYLDDDKSDMVLVRIYGQNTNLLIDRQAETRNFKLLERSGYAPRLYATFNNGLAYEFVPGEVLSKETVRSPDVYPLVARMLAKIHQVVADEGRQLKPVLWDRVRHYLHLIPPLYDSSHKQQMFNEFFPGGVNKLWDELTHLQSVLEKEVCSIVFCHNDLLLANIIHAKEKVTFIDYEYAAHNYQPLDIGNHFAEFAGISDVDYSLYPEKEFQLRWLHIYLEEWNGDQDVTDEQVDTLYKQVNKFALASHFMWTAWALVQAHHSNINFDFIGYAYMRMKEYYNRRDDFLKL